MPQRISKPLNDRIGPWLRQIRGVTTRVLIDEKEGRITEVDTEEGGQVIRLPFGGLSEGTKE